MSVTLEFLARHGGLLLMGTTTLLVLGAVCLFVCRAAIERRRVAELTIAAVLVWLVLASVPLPRLALERLWPQQDAATERAPAAQPFEHSYAEILGARPTEEFVMRVPPPVELWKYDRDRAATADTEEAGAREKVAVEVETAMPPLLIGAASAPASKAAADAQLATPVAEPYAAWTLPVIPTTARNPIDLGRLLAMVYLVGAAAALVWLALGRLLLWRIVRSAAPPEDWLAELYAALPRANRRRPARLVTSAACHRPLSFGVWRPTIVLPAALCRANRAETLGHVLLHEQAHVAQRDAVGGLLFNLALPVLYFHPLYWWIRSRGRLAAELIADDRAAGQTTKHVYAEALVALAQRCGGRWPLPLGATGIFDSHTQFYRRMEMLLMRKESLPTRCSSVRRAAYLVAFMAVVGLLAGAVGVEPLGAQDEENEVEVNAVEEVEETDDPDREVREQDEEEEEADVSDEEVRGEVEELHAQREELEQQLEEMRAELEDTQRAFAEMQALKREMEMNERYEREGRRNREFRGGRRPDPDARRRAGRRGFGRGEPGPEGPAEFDRPPRRAMRGGMRRDGIGRRPERDLFSRPLMGPRPQGSHVYGDREPDPEAAPPDGIPPEMRGPGTSQLDLLPLANDYTDTAGHLEIARAELAHAEELHEKQALSDVELEEKKLQVRMHERQVRVLRIMLDGLIRETDYERKFLEEEIGKMSDKEEERPRRSELERRLIQVETRLEILKEITAD